MVQRFLPLGWSKPVTKEIAYSVLAVEEYLTHLNSVKKIPNWQVIILLAENQHSFSLRSWHIMSRNRSRYTDRKLDGLEFRRTNEPCLKSCVLKYCVFVK